MPQRWTVVLLKTPKVNDFRSNYFPRGFAYKKDALELKKEVESKGGSAAVVKA